LHTNFEPVAPSTNSKLVTVDGFVHIHPKGGSEVQSVQDPSDADIAFAKTVPNTLNLVVGAGNNRVTFFDGSGPIGSMSPKDFMGSKK
jgi:hypothetical protein